MQKTEKEHRQKLAIANFCRGFLYFAGMLTEKEHDQIHKRILKYRDKHQVKISDEQLESVEVKYKD